MSGFYTPVAKCWCLPRRWPGAVRSRPRQWALRQRRRRDQQHGAERWLLRRRSRTALPWHPLGEPLRSPSVALFHRLSAWPHPSPQQPRLQHGQSCGAGRAWWRGTGPEGNGRRSHLRPLHGQQYRVPRLPHQSCLMAGRDGPFSVLSLTCGDTI